VDKNFEETKLDGKRALLLEFEGRINSVDYRGKCYALTHHGIAYWLFAMQTIPIGVDQGIALQQFADLQKQKGLGFHTADNRTGWTEQLPDTVTYASDDERISIKGEKGRWKSSTARDVDAQGEIYLQSVDKARYHKDHEKDAAVLVVRLNKVTADLDEAGKAAADYIESRKKERNESFALKPLDPAKGKKLPRKIGNQMGQVLEFEMTSDDKDYKKYVLLAVVHRPHSTYIIECESFWAYHQSWRGEFLDLINTLHLGAE
jgi:hypothetical protein